MPYLIMVLVRCWPIHQGRRQLREIEGGAKLKSGGQRFSPKREGFFWPKSQIFRPKAGDLQKKKGASPTSEGFFWPKSQILTLFPPKNTNFFLPKKYRGGQEKNRGGGQKRKSGGIAPLPPRWRRTCNSPPMARNCLF